MLFNILELLGAMIVNVFITNGLFIDHLWLLKDFELSLWVYIQTTVSWLLLFQSFTRAKIEFDMALQVHAVKCVLEVEVRATVLIVTDNF